MELWSAWLGTLQSALDFLSVTIGLGTGLSIVVLTLLLRVSLLPVSWSCAHHSCLRQRRLKLLGPELASIRERLRDEPKRYVEETARLYREHGVSPFDGRPVLAALAQMPVLLGMFHLLRQGTRQARFLWVASLARPDLLIAMIAGLTSALIVIVNPDLPEQMRAIMILLPAVLAFVFAMKFASALGLYWIASNCFTAAQTAAVHYVVGKRARAGAVTG
jgi:YidC/Oxa1 family membrane protein insertase